MKEGVGTIGTCGTTGTLDGIDDLYRALKNGGVHPADYLPLFDCARAFATMSRIGAISINSGFSANKYLTPSTRRTSLRTMSFGISMRIDSSELVGVLAVRWSAI